MNMTVEGPIIFWKGPAPFLFLAIPLDVSEQIKQMAKELTYGWGCIPVKASLGHTTWKTALMPKNGHYLVPIKQLVQKAEQVAEGDLLELTLFF